MKEGNHQNKKPSAIAPNKQTLQQNQYPMGQPPSQPPKQDPYPMGTRPTQQPQSNQEAYYKAEPLNEAHKQQTPQQIYPQQAQPIEKQNSIQQAQPVNLPPMRPPPQQVYPQQVPQTQPKHQPQLNQQISTRPPSSIEPQQSPLAKVVKKGVDAFTKAKESVNNARKKMGEEFQALQEDLDVKNNPNATKGNIKRMQKVASFILKQGGLHNTAIKPSPTPDNKRSPSRGQHR